MSSRSKSAGGKGRKPRVFRAIKGGKREFETSRSRGRQVEYAFQRSYPLSEADTHTLYHRVKAEIKRGRQGYRWFYVSALISVLGGLYVMKFAQNQDDEEPSWEHQWVSTKATSKVEDVIDNLNDLLVEKVDFQLQARPAKVIRFRVVFFSNKPRVEDES